MGERIATDDDDSRRALSLGVAPLFLTDDEVAGEPNAGEPLGKGEFDTAGDALWLMAIACNR